ncbi:MAG: DUF4870 domain-containing protein [bacterium]
MSEQSISETCEDNDRFCTERRVCQHTRARRLAVIGYTGILLGAVTIIPFLGAFSLVPLLARDGRDKFAYFHGRQALKLWIWEICAVSSLLIPVIGYLIWIFSYLFCVFFSAAGIYHSLQGKYWRLPLGKVGDIL